MPSLPSDPNHLSAYSKPSVTELVHKKPDAPTFDRVSYASSSSNSNNHANEVPSSLLLSLRNRLRNFGHCTSSPSIHLLFLIFAEDLYRRSMGSLQINQPEPLSRQTSLKPSVESTSRSGSSSTVGSGPNLNYPRDGSARPKMRARGMTDTRTSQRARFFVEDRSSLRKMSQKSPSST